MSLAATGVEILEIAMRLSELTDRRDSLVDAGKKEAQRIFLDAWSRQFPRQTCRVLTAISANADFFSVYLYDVQEGDSEYCFLDGGGWAVPDPESAGDGLPSDGPFPFEAFTAFLHEFGRANPAVRCEPVVRQRVVDVDPNNMHTVRDLRIYYEGADITVLEQGERTSIGWDIPDKYVIVELSARGEPDEVWAWWSTDGHGGPLRNRAMKGTPGYDAFLEWKASHD